jgi:hypothetical protein
LQPSPGTVQLGDTNAIKAPRSAKVDLQRRSGLQAYATVRSMTVTLRDDAAPQVAITGGPLVDGRWKRDRSTVLVDVSTTWASIAFQITSTTAHNSAFRSVTIRLLVRCRG